MTTNFHFNLLTTSEAASPRLMKAALKDIYDGLIDIRSRREVVDRLGENTAQRADQYQYNPIFIQADEDKVRQALFQVLIALDMLIECEDFQQTAREAAETDD